MRREIPAGFELFDRELSRAARDLLGEDEEMKHWNHAAWLVAMMAWSGRGDFEGLGESELGGFLAWDGALARWRRFPNEAISRRWARVIGQGWDLIRLSPAQEHHLRERQGYCEQNLRRVKAPRAALALRRLGEAGALEVASRISWRSLGDALGACAALEEAWRLGKLAGVGQASASANRL